ncbi:hypothetical protein HIM_02391 [Hirsutella minnesotensis 3608]|nr:hypothetical protein HIM_02391 [Hirsutella minnesotensis 3608]
MRALAVWSLAAAVVAAQTQDAPRISSNPTGVMYEASIPQQAFFTQGALNGNVQGSIRAEAPADGNGVKFTVSFSNIPKEGGPFIYHIHAQPVPSDGNCTQTLAHLDPFNRGESPPCDASNPQTCQVGDLSGKYGNVTQDPYNIQYVDPFTSLKEGDAQFFGNRSFVFHFGNKTRITCANFVKMSSSSSTGGSSSGSMYPSGAATGTGAMGTGGVYPTGGVIVGGASTSQMSLPLALLATALLAFAL